MQVALPRKGDRVRATNEEDEDMAEDDEAEEAADEGLAPHACSLALLTIFVLVSFASGVPGKRHSNDASGRFWTYGSRAYLPSEAASKTASQASVMRVDAYSFQDGIYVLIA